MSPAPGVRDLSEAVPTRAPAVAAAHGLRRYPGALRVAAARLAQHYLGDVVDGSLDGVQLLLLLLLLLPLLLLLLEYRVNATGESALKRLDGAQLPLNSCLRLLLLELCFVKEIKNTGQSVGQLGQWFGCGGASRVPLELGQRGYHLV